MNKFIVKQRNKLAESVVESVSRQIVKSVVSVAKQYASRTFRLGMTDPIEWFLSTADQPGSSLTAIGHNPFRGEARLSSPVGTSFYIWKRHLLVFSAAFENKQSSAFVRSVTLYGASVKVFDDLICSIRAGEPDLSRITLVRGMSRRQEPFSWEREANIDKRTEESLFLPGTIFQDTISKINTFQAGREYHERKGIPHHLGILLKGPGGTAKSSFIHAIASSLNRSIHYLDLSTLDSSSNFLKYVNWDKSVLVIEDIDATGADIGDREHNSKKSTDSKMSLSTLLNSLDGIITPPGLIVIATTNHPEHIDPALLRPGRFDIQIELGPIGRDEFVKMATWFDMDPSLYTLEEFVPITGSTMRQILLQEGVEGIVRHQQALQARKDPQ